MNKILLVLISLIFLFGCTPEKKDNELEKDSLKLAETIKDTLKETIKKTRAVYYEPLGDTIYFDFDFEMEDAKEYEKYFIISSYNSYDYDEKLQAELKRWKELEPDSYLETYGTGAVRKYYISLGKFKTRLEIIPIFQDLQKKYPNERINFFSIAQ